MLNDRQIATLLWIVLLLVAVLAWPTGRKSSVDIARAFLSRRIWPIFAVLALWSLGLVFIGRLIGIWTDAPAADTWFWFFTTAVVLLFNFSKVSKEPDFFKGPRRRPSVSRLSSDPSRTSTCSRCLSSSLARESCQSLPVPRPWRHTNEEAGL